ncbi:hypothetical protein [Bacillus marasmi]|uniref:hypothetical protein n=1 Tax=Bacillus marasmi TaxID=1926279 RepID=UPI00164DBD69|nr:hypothetical protein [Bacillus marasmi]
MKKPLENPQYTYFYDEQGTKQVSDQIMDAYSSGFINQYSSEPTQATDTDSLL